MIESISIFGGYIYLYDLFAVLAVATILVAGDILGRKYSFSYVKRLTYASLTWLLRTALVYGTSFLIGQGELAGINHARVVILLPVALFPFVLLLKDSYWKITDYIAPLVSLYHGVVSIGCIFSGCCHGYPSTWGIYNSKEERICFPLQPIEAAIYILIAIVLLVMTKKKIQQGRLYAWYLVFFGFARFLLEFLRDNTKLYWGISEHGFHALASLFVGVVSLVILRKLYERGRLIYE